MTREAKQQLLIVILIVFIGFIGIALPYPIFAPMLLHPQAGDIIPETWHLSSRSILLGIILAAYPFGQFLGSPILGGLSDQYGRKPLLLFCLLGSGIGYLIAAIAINLNLLVLLIASRFVTGFLGGSVSIARAMAANLEGINKYRGFGLIGLATTFGYILGPLLGSLLSDKQIVFWFNYSLPFYLAAALSFFAFILTLSFLQNSQQKIRETSMNILVQLNLIRRIKSLRMYPTLTNMLLVMFFLSLAVDTYYEFFPVYFVGKWQVSAAVIGLFTLILAIAIGLGDFFLVPLLSRRLRDDKSIMLFSAIFIVSTSLIPFIHRIQFLYGIFFIIGLAIAVTTTTIVVLISNIAHQEMQGEAMGLALSVRNLGDGFICLVGGGLVILTYKMPIVLSSIFATISLFLLAFAGKELMAQKNNEY